ncbi:hypothetical protein [uncultured Bradyrhizobium sp.]|jgi:hypothetical protein|uniref:hypothetical protein n=1 Tax=uncultured Bradyrhizobium sp. TaxID=199684 RepID=UPI00263126BA|nr:hypothetical protein [uncultured Bradyrhizobium sp.]
MKTEAPADSPGGCQQIVWRSRCLALKSDRYYSAAVTSAVGCSAETLRSWRNRNGLLSKPGRFGGWTAFTLAEVLAVHLVTRLTSIGISPRFAVCAASQALPVFQRVVDSGEIEPKGLAIWFSHALCTAITVEEIEFIEPRDGEAAIFISHSDLISPVFDRLKAIAGEGERA